MSKAIPTLWAGVAAPFVISAGIVAETLREQGVSAGRQSLSLLSEGGHGNLLRVAEVGAGLLLLLFAVGICTRWRTARLLIAAETAAGVGIIGTGLFIQQRLPPPGVFRVMSPWGYLTGVGLVHIGAAFLLFTALCLAALAAWRHYPAEPPWTPIHVAGGLAALLLLFLLAAFVVAASLNGPSGWLERGAALVAIVFQEMLAIHLIGVGAPTAPDVGPRAVITI